MQHDLAWLIGKCYKYVLLADTFDTWVFKFSGTIELFLLCPWQIISDGKVSVGSGDYISLAGLDYFENLEKLEDVPVAEKLTQLLARRPIQSIAIDKVTGGLALTFQGDTELRTFTNSTGIVWWLRRDNKSAIRTLVLSRDCGRIEVSNY